jgi:glycosyltransferase involved in cell wall biosynthesis
MPKTLAGIPALNAEQTIAKLIVHAMKWVDQVVVVDDGSVDDTALVASKLGAIVIRHRRNLGKGAALRDLFKYARAENAKILVTLDADGQHNPDDIPSILKPIADDDADVVIASRRPENVPKARRLGGRVLDRMTSLASGGDAVDSQSGFRAYSRKALAHVSVNEFGMGVDTEILVKAKHAGLRVVEIPVIMKYKDLQTSTHHPVYHWLDVFFSLLKFISIRHPLTFYGGFSALMFLIATVFGVQTLDYYTRWGRVVTNLALVSVAAGILGFLSFFTGVILFTLITVVRDEQFR